MFEENEIQRKINQIFKDTKLRDDDLKDKLFPSGKMELEDMTDEERKEVENSIKEIYSRRPSRPRKVWKWKFVGRLIIKGILLIFEVILFAIVLFFLLPLAINLDDFTIKQALANSCLWVLIKEWWK